MNIKQKLYELCSKFYVIEQHIKQTKYNFPKMYFRYIQIAITLTLIDIYFFNAIKTVSKNRTVKQMMWIRIAYFSTTVMSIALILSGIFLPFNQMPKWIQVNFTSFIFVLMVAKIFGILVLLADDITRGLKKIVLKLTPNEKKFNNPDIQKIPRSEFLSKAAIITAFIPFSGMLYGMLKGAFDYTIHKTKVKIKNLPSGLEGLKIVQISDLHTGSFTSTEPLKKAVDIINGLNADIVLFTGDLVNNYSEEALMHINTLKEVKAKYGVYSVLGNHDYGDYVKWSSPEKKQENFDSMLSIHKEIGWKLLRNEKSTLNINGADLDILGVENWGRSLNFPKYGDLKKTIADSTANVRILMSHDPSHWEAEVLNSEKPIDLTLSGHTHGMQFGIEIPGFKWSPVQYVYKQWAGLYQNDKRNYLYVNRGLGFIGYAGRVGINPEISLLELEKA